MFPGKAETKNVKKILENQQKKNARCGGRKTGRDPSLPFLFRDELDMVRERAEKVDKLEAEILRYKEHIQTN